jgi:Leucine-rich repeat (LRR) protein
MKKIFLLYLLLFSFSKIWGQSTVTNFGELNSAIQTANGFAGDYTITLANDISFDMSQLPIALPTWVRPINKAIGKLTIIGQNHRIEKIGGSSPGRILEIQLGSVVEILNLTIMGADGVNINGGGILNNGALTSINCTIRNNSLSGNVANGAGIYNQVNGDLRLTNCTINNNTINSIGTVFQGAGIYHNGLNLRLQYCTVSTNGFSGSGTFQGGGIYVNNPDFQLDNVTIAHNTGVSVGGNGGGIYTADITATNKIRNCIILGNTNTALPIAPDDIYTAGTQVIRVQNTLTNNLGTSSYVLDETDALAANIIDNTLRNNGGVTQTHALLPNINNIAIEGGINLTYTTDQRGDDIIGNLPDIGAYEFGTFWVVNNNSTSLVGSLGFALAGVNTSFPNAPQSALNTTLKQVKFNIPFPNNNIIVDFNPTLNLPAIINATTQTNYMLNINSRAIISKGTGNAGTGLQITSNATNSEVYGLNWVNFNIAGIDINAKNVTIGDFMPPFNGLNVFQRCGAGIRIFEDNAKIYRNFFGLNAFDGTDGGATTHNLNYDIQIGGTNSVTGTIIGALAKNNTFAGRNGGIMFSSGFTISNTTIAYNGIGQSVAGEIIDGGSTVGIHTNGDVNGLTIQNNVIVSRPNAAAIFLNDNSKNVNIANNQIGWRYVLTTPTPRPNLYGIQIRGGGLSNNIIIQHNTIAGNYMTSPDRGIGIYIENELFTSNAITIQNNRIGLANDAGETALANEWGIHANGFIATGNYLTINNNIISGNHSKGIYVQNGRGVVMTNNRLGLKTDQTYAPNTGVSVHAIGSCLIDNNTISGNYDPMFSYDAINIQGSDVIISNNRIGTNITGTEIRANSGVGIDVAAGLTGIAITNNTISGNNTGVITASAVTFTGNIVGLNSTGTAKLLGTYPAGWTNAIINQGLVIGGTVSTMTIDNNTFSDIGAAGISLATNANAIQITNNKIGTDITGNNAILDGGGNVIRNQTGVFVNTNVIATVIRNNTISGNATGVLLQSPITNATDFTNNVIGLNSIGSAKLINLPTTQFANSGIGVMIDNGAANTIIQENTVADCSFGINTNVFCTIRNNKIGLNSAGNVAFPNYNGVLVNSGIVGGTVMIGGANPSDGNSFAATETGLALRSRANVLNNAFGATHGGTSPLPNFGTDATNGFANHAISTENGSDNTFIENNVIGGARNGLSSNIVGNMLLGSGAGIGVTVNGLNILNNKIGLTNNDNAIPNDIGIHLQGGTTFNNCLIGDLGQGNIISNNLNAAIYVAVTTTVPLKVNYNTIGLNTSATALSSVSSLFGIAAESVAAIGMIGNAIENTTLYGVKLLGATPPLNVISNNQIGVFPFAELNTESGISVIAGNTISQNIVENAGGVGIQVFGNDNTINGNSINKNKKQGINIQNGNANRIIENSIFNNGSAANNFAEKGIDLNLTTPQEGNNGQPTPTLLTVTPNSPNTGDVTITGSFQSIVGNDYVIEFYHTEGGSILPEAVEGETYLGQTPTITATATTTTFSQIISPSPIAISPTDYITATLRNITNSNTSEFSLPLLVCSTTIAGITTQNPRTNCQVALVDVRININTTTVMGSLFNVDADGNGTYEFTNLALQNDANGNFLLLPDINTLTFDNPRVFDQTAVCTSPAFITPQPIIIRNNSLPRPFIISARVVQPTVCNTPNGQLIVKIQNGNAGQSYELSTNGAFGAEYSGLILGTDSTLRITNLSTSAVIGNLEVYQGANQCYSQPFSFAARMTAPNQNIDTTLTVTIREDEISPNFNTVVSLANSQDSVSYRLRNKTNGVFIGQAKNGNGNTLTFDTDTLTQDGTYTYEIVATHNRTSCSRILAQTVSVKVISGILPEELDLLREVYNSTNGNNWLTKWDFSQPIHTFLGVAVFGGRVTSILLANNNLTGTLTPKILDFRRLRTVDISRNGLDFGSVENYTSRGFAFKYDLQDKINRQIDTTAYTDSRMVLSVVTQGNFNSYQWQKNGQNIPNATNPNLVFNALTLTDAGLYTCLVRNSRGTQLTLERRSIRLRVNQKVVSSVDLTLLRELNAALGGENWTNKWIMDGSVPVAEWYGVMMEGDKIKSINLANNNLVGQIPNIIPLTNNILSDLIYLNLSGNKISGAIPKSLGNLSKLQYLDISDNLLTGEVIEELGNLGDLTTLWIAKNSFKTIHVDIGKLQKLENFFAHHNLFATIPNTLGSLTNLKKLNLNNNLLTTIPNSFSGLVKLENLSLANNQIATLPNIFTNLGTLQELYLQNNLLAILPNSFVALRNLTVFNLHTNFLDFADFEPLATLPVLNAAGAIYEPQIKVGTAQEVLFTLDQMINITQSVNGTANIYQWFRNGVAISGATANRFQKNFINLADAGTYTLHVKNTIAQKLTLISQDIVVTVSCGNSTSITINTGGTTKYCENETINTLLTANINAGIEIVGYRWLRSGSVLANETQRTLSIIQAGEYSLQVRDNNGCVFLSPTIKIEVLPKPTVQINRTGDSLRATISNAKGNVQFLWYKDNNLMSEIKAQTILARTNGLYYVVVTDDNNCPTKSAGINLVVTGIDEELSAKTVVYPNPTQGELYITLPDNFTLQHSQLYNVLGQRQIMTEKILSSTQLLLNTENLASGVYNLLLEGKNGVQIHKKIVKQ